jgi:NAD(P)-dependent dehydrogenase (short-subunit alcohol dehydrogenase family)
LKVLVIGATGVIGKEVVKALEDRHEVIASSRSSGVRIDIEDPVSIMRGLDNLAPLDAVIVIAGTGPFGPLDELGQDSFEIAVISKLMGQINVVRQARDTVVKGGCIILTSGMLATQPWPGGSALAMANGGLEGFTRVAALDREGHHRINAVSPPMVRETAEIMGLGEQGTPAAVVAQEYVKALEGDKTGLVYTGDWA